MVSKIYGMLAHATMIKFLALDVLGVQYHIDLHERTKSLFTICKYRSAFVPEISKFKISLKYAN